MMAIVTSTNLSKLLFSNRIDAELYQPHLIKSYDHIKSLQWEYKKIGQCCLIRSGTTPSDRNDNEKEGAILFKTTDIRNNVIIDSDDLYRISEKIHLRMNKTNLQKKDILLNIVGATLGVIGRSALLNDILDENEGNITQAMVLIRIINNDLLPGYLFAYLNSRYAQDQIKRYARPTGQYNLNLFEVGEIIIPIIPMKYQEQIENLIFNAERQLKISKGLYRQAQDHLEEVLGLDQVPINNTKCYETNFSEVIHSFRGDAEYFNPTTKEIVNRITQLRHLKIKECFSVSNGYPWSSSKFLSEGLGEPVVRIRNIRPGQIDNKTLTTLDRQYVSKIQDKKAKKGDLVVGMDGINYFYSAIIQNDCYVNQRVAHLSPRQGTPISPEYTSFIMNSNIGQNQLLRDMTVANTVGHITNKNLSELVIPVPSQEFHDEVTSLISQSFDAKKESELLLNEAMERVENFIEGGIE
ncbi:restriction endonuclease subunit S [Lysinibacillus sphaericus]